MRPTSILCATLILALTAGCGGGGTAKTEPRRTTSAPASSAPEPSRRVVFEPLRHAHCPPDASNCSTAEGTIAYIERVDPDGDGDAHFVLISLDSITAPGISVIDVEKDLRPHPLPDVGDRVSAAGPVYRGHLDQAQIQATELYTAAVR
jgi:hypothetical protein